MSENIPDIPEDILVLLMEQWEGDLPADKNQLLKDYLAQNPAVDEYWQSRSFLRKELDSIKDHVGDYKLSDIKKAQLLQLSQGKKSEWRYWLFYGVAASLFFSMIGGFYYVAYEKAQEGSRVVLHENLEVAEEAEYTSFTDDIVAKEAAPHARDEEADVPMKLRAKTDSKKVILENELKEERSKKDLQYEAEVQLSSKVDASVEAEEAQKAQELNEAMNYTLPAGSTEKAPVASMKVLSETKSLAFDSATVQKFSSKEWGFDKFKELSGLQDLHKLINPEEKKEVFKKSESIEILKEADSKEQKHDKTISKSSPSKDKLEGGEDTSALKNPVALALDLTYNQLSLLRSYYGVEERKVEKEQLLLELRKNSYFKDDPSFQAYLEQYK